MNIQSVRFAVPTCVVCASPHAEGKDCRGNVYEGIGCHQNGRKINAEKPNTVEPRLRRLDGHAADMDMFQKSQRLREELAEADCRTESEPASAAQGVGYAYVYESCMAE